MRGRLLESRNCVEDSSGEVVDVLAYGLGGGVLSVGSGCVGWGGGGVGEVCLGGSYWGFYFWWSCAYVSVDIFFKKS